MCKCLNWLFGKPEPEEVYYNENPVKKALLVGINKYPMSPLRGCVNDVLLVHKIISEKFDFKKENINVLTDEECTKVNIVTHLNKLVKDVKPGDYILFHYSGHGSQVMSNDWTSGDEVDGMDEILCPVNLNWKDPFRDHDLGKIFSSVPEGVKILIILDCCHSGTGLRNTWAALTDPRFECETEKDWVNRFVPPPPSNILSDPRVSVDDQLKFVVPKSVEKKKIMVDTAKQGNAILISGCQENQTSADAYIDGRYQGAMTYVLAQTLVENNYDITYRDLIKLMNEKTNNMSFTQNPQLEAKEKLFGRKFLK